MENVTQLNNLDEWESLKKEAEEKCELILLKVSPVCSISHSVENLFDKWYSEISENQKLKCAKVDVVNARPLSRHIADELSVFHQSPQIIWLDEKGKVKWSESHYSITRDELEAHLS